MIHSDLFIFANVIRISMKVPSINIILYIGRLKGENRPTESQPRYLSNFLFTNLQIKSIVEFTFHKVVHSINEKETIFTKYAFWDKKITFQEFSNFSESFGQLFLTPWLLEAVDMNKLLILSRIVFKGPLDPKYISNFESITYSVKQRENVFACP